MEGRRQAPCPNCGGPIEFGLGTSAAQICPYCRHSVVRTDRDLASLGKVADLVPTAPAMTVGDRGAVGDREFVVGGRLQLDHGQGPWDEWYVEFPAERRWAWLAKAQGRWYLTSPVATSGLPTFEQMVVGGSGSLPGAEGTWTVAEKSGSVLVSAEGELPEAVRPGESGRYIDLEAPGGGFATIDYGDGSEAPKLYVGQQLAHDQVRFTKSAIGPRPEERVQVGKLSCPSCGAPIELSSPDSAQRAACSSCHSLLDHSAGNLAIVGKLDELTRNVYLPLGTRGTLRGVDVLVIGTMERYVVDGGITYSWTEYLLHSAQGYRWLVEDSGHFTFVAPVSTAEVQDQGFRAKYEGRDYRAFNRGTATVKTVLGEFYWKVAAGETVQTADYIAPPYILSSERNEKEISWSAGEYVPSAEIWQAFSLPGSPPRQLGIGAAQPNTVERKSAAWFAAAVGVCLLAIFALGKAIHRPVPDATLVQGPLTLPAVPDEDVAMQAREVRVIGTPSIGTAATPPSPPRRCTLGTAGDPSAPTITPTFTLPSDASAVRVTYEPSGVGAWIGIHSTLINTATGEARQWEESVDQFRNPSGSMYRQTQTIGRLTPGPYTLVVDTHWAREACPPGAPPAMTVTVTTAHATNTGPGACCCSSAAGLALLPLIIAALRRSGFEKRRWQNSSLG